MLLNIFQSFLFIFLTILFFSSKKLSVWFHLQIIVVNNRRPLLKLGKKLFDEKKKFQILITFDLFIVL